MQTLLTLSNAFHATSTYFLLLFVVLAFILISGSGLIGFAPAPRKLASALLVGFAVVYGIAVLAYKAGLGGVLSSILISLFVFGIIRIFRFYLSSYKSKFFSIKMLSASVLQTVLIIAAGASLGTFLIFIQVTTAYSGLPLPTSFDTSSGDMFFYLNFADHVKNVGWDGVMNQKFDSTAFDDGLETPSELGYDHVGTGLVFISALSSLLSLSVWQVGQVALISGLLTLVTASAIVLSTFAGLSRRASVVISCLLFTSFAYLALIGWWALNQILFSALYLISVVVLRLALLEENLYGKTRLWFLVACCSVLATETYPSVSAYGLLPVIFVIFGIDFVRSIKRYKKRVTVLVFSFLPFAFLLLGTGQFIPRIFRDQYGNQLDINLRAPGFLQFLGFPPQIDGVLPSEIEVALAAITSPAVAGAIVLLLVIRKVSWIKARIEYLPLALISSGGALLLIYSSLNITTYQSHKIALQWIPFIFLSLGGLYSDELRQIRFRSIRDAIFAVILVVTLGNQITWQVFSATFLSTKENLQLHSISKDMLDIKDELDRLDLESVLMDMSGGSGWIPLDRTVAGALVSYPGTRIVSSWKLSGYPYFTGWVVSQESGNYTESHSQRLYSNDSFQINYVCRLICAPKEINVSALISGLPEGGNSEESATWVMGQNSPSTTLSAYVEGSPGSQIKISSTWEAQGESAESCDSGNKSQISVAQVSIGVNGYIRLGLTPNSSKDCHYGLKGVEISAVEIRTE